MIDAILNILGTIFAWIIMILLIIGFIGAVIHGIKTGLESPKKD